MKRPWVSTLGDESPAALLLRRARVGYLQARRLLAWTGTPEAWRKPAIAAGRAEFPYCIYIHESRISRSDDAAEPALERGKRINLALAAPHFNGLVLAPEQPLSFWRVLGRCTRARGFRPGMELRGGCIVPALGGGLCLLSNQLFRMACELGWTIIERHGHTMEAAPPAPGEPVWGLDATVFWPYVDLRVAPRTGPIRLSVEVIGEIMRIRVDAQVPHDLAARLHNVDDVIHEQDGRRMRSSRVVRDLTDTRSGALVAREVVADNRRLLLHSDQQRRNCLSCHEEQCRARPHELIRLASKT